METNGNSKNASGLLDSNTSKPYKRVVPKKYWAFTLNNPKAGDITKLETIFKSQNYKYLFGEEIAPNTGTPHLQGFIQSPNKIRINEKQIDSRIHWEPCKSNEENNIKYCRKNFKVFTNMEDIISDPLDGLTLYEWQFDIIELIKTKPDPRTINWYYDASGCKGKTSLAKHLCIHLKDILYLQGNANDIKYAVASCGFKPKTCIFNFTRSKEDYISYEAIESIKDGIFFSGKYESKMFVMNSPHVIIFANFEPNKTKLSLDRWNIVKIGS